MYESLKRSLIMKMQFIKLICTGFLWTPFLSIAQAPYTGGPGDGYAMAETTNIMVNAEEPVAHKEMKIYPNPVIQGEGVEVVIPLKSAGPAELWITGAQGIKIIAKTLTFQNHFFISTGSLTSGNYRIHISRGERQWTGKLVILK